MFLVLRWSFMHNLCTPRKILYCSPLSRSIFIYKTILYSPAFTLRQSSEIEEVVYNMHVEKASLNAARWKTFRKSGLMCIAWLSIIEMGSQVPVYWHIRGMIAGTSRVPVHRGVFSDLGASPTFPQTLLAMIMFIPQLNIFISKAFFHFRNLFNI